ncbi:MULTISPECIES: DUF5304 family protein [Streptomycetaceae]|uniref:DUF5304 domain-containing protein n=1 Tax=Actinacidiphila glaucinigra TaxID=235986 RepID=A0A238ZQ23_9ACTN|nr:MULTISPECIES: DUF5304 family protein [Streptomycetaceae]MDX2852798.1 DUF5304 family protein [Streptomyces sp. PA03-3a]MYX32476.1 hypothetical protein [Streptomyces sp. SID8377]WSD62583.1 DUF5304 domain-containing protein [Actinacidiphila glaucinigra]SNR85242.1 hypothetical protein SAMN05216252_101454 [Actinacidiphila glaucinigra]
MSESTDRAGRPDADSDAWAKASAEDIAAENARRRQQSGQTPGSAGEELRRLAEAVTDRLSMLRTPAAEMAAQGLISQVKQAVEPIVERNPEVFDHLAAAGAELLAAYRAAVSGQERRWTSGGDTPPSERIDLD